MDDLVIFKLINGMEIIGRCDLQIRDGVYHVTEALNFVAMPSPETQNVQIQMVPLAVPGIGKVDAQSNTMDIQLGVSSVMFAHEVHEETVKAYRERTSGVIVAGSMPRM